MHHDFQIVSLSDTHFNFLFGLSALELATHGAVRMVVTEKPGTPCRVSLVDAEIGEEVILVPFKHHDVDSPYQAVGPIFVRKGVFSYSPEVNEVPLMFYHRLLSIRAYDMNAMMINACVVEGGHLSEKIVELFGDVLVEYLHIHNAKPGCYNCKVERIKID